MTRRENALAELDAIADVLATSGDLELAKNLREARDTLADADADTDTNTGSDDWHPPIEGIETAADFIDWLNDRNSVERVWGPHTNPPEHNFDHDMAMPDREIIRFQMKTHKPVDYKLSATLRMLGFVHEYTDTRRTGSKYNPTKTIQQWWSRPANGGDDNE